MADADAQAESILACLLIPNEKHRGIFSGHRYAPLTGSFTGGQNEELITS
jgi:hypothetical protein